VRKLTIALVVVVAAFGAFLKLSGQGAYSNASLNGTYAFSFAGSGGTSLMFNVPTTPLGNNAVFSFPAMKPMSVVGRFSADGAGNISSGSVIVFDQGFNTTDGENYTVVDRTCNTTISGSYSILTSGAGTLTINASGCGGGGGSLTFNLLLGGSDKVKGAAESGVAYMTPTTPNVGGFSSYLAGTFTKQ
jgi:hypothetical protein